MTEVFDRAWDVLMVALGLSCVWVGCWAVLRPRQPLMLEGRPVWVVRAWGLGYVLLGISLTIESVTLMAAWGAGLASGRDALGCRTARGRLAPGGVPVPAVGAPSGPGHGWGRQA